MHTVGYKDIDAQSNSGTKDYSLVLGIGTKRIDKSSFWISVSSIGVFGKDREDEPAIPSAECLDTQFVPIK